MLELLNVFPCQLLTHSQCRHGPTQSNADTASQGSTPNSVPCKMFRDITLDDPNPLSPIYAVADDTTWETPQSESRDHIVSGMVPSERIVFDSDESVPYPVSLASIGNPRGGNTTGEFPERQTYDPINAAYASLSPFYQEGGVTPSVDRIKRVTVILDEYGQVLEGEFISSSNNSCKKLTYYLDKADPNSNPHRQGDYQWEQQQPWSTQALQDPASGGLDLGLSQLPLFDQRPAREFDHDNQSLDFGLSSYTPNLSSVNSRRQQYRRLQQNRDTKRRDPPALTSQYPWTHVNSGDQVDEGVHHTKMASEMLSNLPVDQYTGGNVFQANARTQPLPSSRSSQKRTYAQVASSPKLQSSRPTPGMQYHSSPGPLCPSRHKGGHIHSMSTPNIIVRPPSTPALQTPTYSDIARRATQETSRMSSKRHSAAQDMGQIAHVRNDRMRRTDRSPNQQQSGYGASPSNGRCRLSGAESPQHDSMNSPKNIPYDMRSGHPAQPMMGDSLSGYEPQPGRYGMPQGFIQQSSYPPLYTPAQDSSYFNYLHNATMSNVFPGAASATPPSRKLENIPQHESDRGSEYFSHPSIDTDPNTMADPNAMAGIGAVMTEMNDGYDNGSMSEKDPQFGILEFLNYPEENDPKDGNSGQDPSFDILEFLNYPGENDPEYGNSRQDPLGQGWKND
jgi:hypothetical protein